MTIWAEVWSRPGAPTFGRLIDFVPSPSMGLHDGLNLVGNGNMSIAESFDRLDDILLIDPTTPANSAASLIRYFSELDPTTPFFEWLPSSILPAGSKTDFAVDATGLGIKSVLSHARLEAWDWDGSVNFVPTIPDWVYGGPDIAVNGSFETEGMINGGFELGSADRWSGTTADGIFGTAGIQAVNDPANARSGDWYGVVDVNADMEGARYSLSGLIIGTTYTLTGFLRDITASGDRFRAGITAGTATHTNAYEEFGYWWAELGNSAIPGSSDGTWQSFTLTFLAESNQADLAVVWNDTGTPLDFRLDDWAISGFRVGLAPWFPVGIVNIMERTTAQASCGVASLRIQVTDFAVDGVYNKSGAQASYKLKIGQPYTAKVRVRVGGATPVTITFQAIRRTPKGVPGTPGSSWIQAAVVQVSPGVWTDLQFAFVADVTEVDLSVRYWAIGGPFGNTSTSSPDIFIDCFQLLVGLPATTIGGILGDIYADATTDHAGRVVWEDEANSPNPYLTLDFSDTVDSNGAAWAHPAISVKLWMRMSYLQIMDQFVRGWEYEWRIVPDDVEAGTWLWQVYNPGTMHVDYTAAQTPAIQGGSQDTRRRIARFLPATDFMVEGLQRVTARFSQATLQTALGRIEASTLDRELPGLPSAVIAAAAAAADALPASLSLAYSLVNPTDLPLVNYLIGDLLNVIDPPTAPLIAARVMDVQASITPRSVTWEVSLSP